MQPTARIHLKVVPLNSLKRLKKSCPEKALTIGFATEIRTGTKGEAFYSETDQVGSRLWEDSFSGPLVR